jgi:CMP-N-acetylneuraminic acid synthetase
MIQGKRVLAIVPARGGSKGIKLKNLQKVNGVPLVGLVGAVIRECSSIDRAVVSTDHQEIAEVARHYGIDVPFMRPENLSGDQVADMPVLRHALEATEADDGTRYDIVVMLQPTSPFRRAEHVERCLRDLGEKNLDAAWTVSETDSKAHPLKQLIMRDGLLEYWDERGAAIIARQQLSPVYHRNGVAYALTREALLKKDGALLAQRTGAVVIDEPLVNIDGPMDLEFATFLAEQNSASIPKD